MSQEIFEQREEEETTKEHIRRPVPEELRIAGNIFRELSDVPLAKRRVIMDFVVSICNSEE